MIKIEYLRGLRADMVKRQTPGSAGMDLRAVIDIPVRIYPGETKMIPSGIRLKMPVMNVGEVICAKIYNRSGISTKHGITLANQVAIIDADFNKEIMIPLRNLNTEGEPFIVEPMMRVAQLTFERVLRPELIEEAFEDGGRFGFGSTGIK